MLAHEKQIQGYEETIAKFKKQHKENPLLSEAELGKLEKKLAELKKGLQHTLSLGAGYYLSSSCPSKSN